MTSALDLLTQRARLATAGCASDVASPCISICRIDPTTDLCEGCWRTLDEIASWSRMADEDKRRVWTMIEQRIERSRP